MANRYHERAHGGNLRRMPQKPDGLRLVGRGELEVEDVDRGVLERAIRAVRVSYLSREAPFAAEDVQHR